MGVYYLGVKATAAAVCLEADNRRLTYHLLYNTGWYVTY